MNLVVHHQQVGVPTGRPLDRAGLEDDIVREDHVSAPEHPHGFHVVSDIRSLRGVAGVELGVHWI